MNTTENKRKHTHSNKQTNKKTWNSKILAKLQKTRAQQNKKTKANIETHAKVDRNTQSGSRTSASTHTDPSIQVGHACACTCPGAMLAQMERDPRVCIHHCVCDSSKENFNVLDQVYGIRVRTCLCMMKKKKNGKGYSQVREGNQKKSKK